MLIIITLLCLSFIGAMPLSAQVADSRVQKNIDRMLGEELSYDISFLLFSRIANGTISFSPGPEAGQYTALFQAETHGIAAFLTRNRVERIETVMELAPEGGFQPLVQTAQTTRNSGGRKQERVRIYRFDYAERQVHYTSSSTGKPTYHENYPMGAEGPIYDLLSAFYNVRAGVFGPLVYGRELALPTFSRRGVNDLIVTRVVKEDQQRHFFFPDDTILCKVLIDPATFKTKTGEILIGFDEEMAPSRVVVKKVLGLGDVRGILRKVADRLEGQLAQSN